MDETTIKAGRSERGKMKLAYFPRDRQATTSFFHSVLRSVDRRISECANGLLGA